MEDDRRNVSRRGFLRSSLGLTLVGMTPTAAFAESYPSRSVRLVIAWPAGATADYFGRLFGDWLHSRSKQAVVVDNVVGASGAVGARNVARSQPDGYNLLSGNAPEIAINPHLTKDIGYDPLDDFEQISLLGNVPLGLVVPPKSPYRSVADLIERARKNSDKLNFASAGFGTPGHFAGEAFALASGVNMVHVPYKGGAPALNDILGGFVDLYFVGLPAALPQHASGNLRLLAVSTAERAPAAMSIPTMKESGIRDFEFTLWAGLQAPKGTSASILEYLSKEVKLFLEDPGVKSKVRSQGSEPIFQTRKEYVDFVNAESRKYAELAKALDIKR